MFVDCRLGPAHTLKRVGVMMPVTDKPVRGAAKAASKPGTAPKAKSRPERETDAEKEARMLQEFKEMMVKYGGKGSFAGLDE
jgi:hypothetical protein